MQAIISTRWERLAERLIGCAECSICYQTVHLSRTVCGEHERDDEEEDDGTCANVWCTDCLSKIQWTDVTALDRHLYVSVACPFCRVPVWVRLRKALGVQVLGRALSFVAPRIHRLELITELLHGPQDECVELAYVELDAA